MASLVLVRACSAAAVGLVDEDDCGGGALPSTTQATAAKILTQWWSSSTARASRAGSVEILSWPDNVEGGTGSEEDLRGTI